MSPGSIGTDDAPGLAEAPGGEAPGTEAEGPPPAGLGAAVGAGRDAGVPGEAVGDTAIAGSDDPAELPQAATSPATANATTAPSRAAGRASGTSR
jgi:hypothetical protein